MDWIESRTDHDRAWWMARVERTIRKHTKPTKDPNHGETDTRAVLKSLTDDVWKCRPASGEYDGNLWAFSTLGYVVSLWYARCHRAKVMDPIRPVKLRRNADARRLDWVMGMMAILVDDTRDPTYFPNQDWDYPWSADAKDGTFI